jgi:hypothetical protein
MQGCPQTTNKTDNTASGCRLEKRATLLDTRLTVLPSVQSEESRRVMTNFKPRNELGTRQLSKFSPVCFWF